MFYALVIVFISQPKYVLWVLKENIFSLTLKAPITTVAVDKFCDIFPNFRKK